jgi:outer membrane protein TolC
MIQCLGKRLAFVPVIPFLLWGQAPDAGAQEKANAAFVLTLQEAIDRSLAHNLGLQIERIGPTIAEEDISVAKSEFDPVIFLNGNLDKQVSPQAASLLDGAEQPVSHSRSLTSGVTKKFSPGTVVGLSTSVTRRATNSLFATLNPEHTAGVAVDVRQPLLKGAWKKVNLASLVRSQAAFAQTRYQLRRRAIDLITETEIGYWNVAYAHARMSLQQSSLEVAGQLLREAREKERLGLATAIDVLQAKAAFAARRESIILAEQAVKDSEDVVFSVLSSLQIENPHLIVASLPEEDIAVPALAALYARTQEFDLDLSIQREVISQRELDVRVARNNRLPNLDLTVQGGLAGRDVDGSEAFHNALDRDGYSWRAGVEVTVPWGFRAERSRYRKAQMALQQQQLLAESLDQDLLFRVRTAWRALVAGKERLEVTRASLTLSEEQFEAVRAKFNAGLSTFREVLEGQEDLDEARKRKLDALIDSIRASARLARFDGAIMDRHGYAWEEVDALTAERPESPEKPSRNGS